MKDQVLRLPMTCF